MFIGEEMSLKNYINDHDISLYQLAERSNVSYTTVFNLANDKSSIDKCSFGTVKKIARALDISTDDLATLCHNDRPFFVFRSEQCHLVKRKGELDYLIDVLKNDLVSEYWRLSFHAEALYLLGMLDYICHRNGFPECENYNTLRKYRLNMTLFPIDTYLDEALLKDPNVYKDAIDGCIPEFYKFNIVERNIFDDER